MDRKLRDLHQHRADLVVEAGKLSNQKFNIDESGLLMDRLRSAVLHRLQRIPIILQHVDREIEQAQADIDNHEFWHGKRKTVSGPS